jgi:hypothetical protein
VLELEGGSHVARACEVEPGIGEIEGHGYAEIYYGVEASSDVMVSVRASSQEVIQLICDFAAELRMAVFVPTENSWGAVVLDPSLVDDLPDESWEGWENFGDGFRPPAAVVCEGAGNSPQFRERPTTTGRRGRTMASSRAPGRLQVCARARCRLGDWQRWR